MPTRPSQNDPDRVELWKVRRRIVGATIRRLRREQGLTQELLAQRASIDRTVLVAVESGRRSVVYERLFDIADALGVPLSELVRDRDG